MVVVKAYRQSAYGWDRDEHGRVVGGSYYAKLLPDRVVWFNARLIAGFEPYAGCDEDPPAWIRVFLDVPRIEHGMPTTVYVPGNVSTFVEFLSVRATEDKVGDAVLRAVDFEFPGSLLI